MRVGDIVVTISPINVCRGHSCHHLPYLLMLVCVQGTSLSQSPLLGLLCVQGTSLSQSPLSVRVGMCAVDAVSVVAFSHTNVDQYVHMFLGHVRIFVCM